VCLFGCGGNRDKGKRPVMGGIAADLADHVIVTDDNPRFEQADVIRSEVMAGVTKNDAENIGDRRVAIQHAVGMLKQGDVLVIAGKGHEQGQIIGDRVEHFDDVEEAATAILNIGLGEA
jgi:UDP-N-acetylmuramoyl-L-alanyl-D-glutamate--2,6-diaminopimelate ligase